MKVLDYALNALAASATDVAHDSRNRAAVSYPTPGLGSARAPHAPRAPIPTAAAIIPPSRAHTVRTVRKARDVVASDQEPDASKPMLGLYPEDQVKREETTFENGLDSKKWIVDTRYYGGAEYNPFMRQMETKNVEVKDGLLRLKVPGGQTYDPSSTVGLSSAQIMSTVMFSVGSLEMKVKMSSEDGTCQCAFLYGSDQNEVDMEYLTNTTTNWAVVQGQGREKPIQQIDLNITAAQTDSFHTWKLVRTESKAYFLFDGEIVNTFDKNIPTEPAQAMVAHWTDANPGWTRGPPAQDTVMTVEKIVVEYVGETKTFTTSTASPSATGNADDKKGAASRGYGSTSGPLLAVAALCLYFAL